MNNALEMNFSLIKFKCRITSVSNKNDLQGTVLKIFFFSSNATEKYSKTAVWFSHANRQKMFYMLIDGFRKFFMENNQMKFRFKRKYTENDNVINNIIVLISFFHHYFDTKQRVF